MGGIETWGPTPSALAEPGSTHRHLAGAPSRKREVKQRCRPIEKLESIPIGRDSEKRIGSQPFKQLSAFIKCDFFLVRGSTDANRVYRWAITGKPAYRWGNENHLNHGMKRMCTLQYRHVYAFASTLCSLPQA